MSRGKRRNGWSDEDRELPRSARERPRGRGRGDRPSRERRKPAREQTPAPAATLPPPADEVGVVTILMDEERVPGGVKSCGLCRNWFDRGTIGGRGECDHPGSGMMYPYDDTPACPFFVRR